MSIRPIEMNGMLQRTEDISVIKHQQDTKAVLDQKNLQSHMIQRDDELSHHVMDSESSSKLDGRMDAREEGKNSYFYNKKKQKKNKKSEDKVIKKAGNPSFDVKI